MYVCMQETRQQFAKYSNTPVSRKEEAGCWPGRYNSIRAHGRSHRRPHQLALAVQFIIPSAVAVISTAALLLFVRTDVTTVTSYLYCTKGTKRHPKSGTATSSQSEPSPSEQNANAQPNTRLLMSREPERQGGMGSPPGASLRTYRRAREIRFRGRSEEHHRMPQPKQGGFDPPFRAKYIPSPHSIHI